jgi:hypothetical protein
MGLKPIAGEPLEVFNRMRSDEVFRSRAVEDARGRLGANLNALRNPILGPRLVDPESVEVEETTVAPPVITGRMIRAEAQLVRRYRRWLDPEGTRLRGLVVPAPGGQLRADLVDTALNILIEAKAESSRANVRYAIGQLFDYQRYMDDPRPDLAILLPHPLSADLQALPEGAGIGVIWESGDGFTDSAGGRLTVRS